MKDNTIFIAESNFPLSRTHYYRTCITIMQNFSVKNFIKTIPDLEATTNRSIIICLHFTKYYIVTFCKENCHIFLTASISQRIRHIHLWILRHEVKSCCLPENIFFSKKTKLIKCCYIQIRCCRNTHLCNNCACINGTIHNMAGSSGIPAIQYSADNRIIPTQIGQKGRVNIHIAGFRQFIYRKNIGASVGYQYIKGRFSDKIQQLLLIFNTVTESF